MSQINLSRLGARPEQTFMSQFSARVGQQVSGLKGVGKAFSARKCIMEGAGGGAKFECTALEGGGQILRSRHF